MEIDKDVPQPPRIKERADIRSSAAGRTDPTERKRRMPGFQDKYHIPENVKPEGISFEWKRIETFGQEDRAYQANLNMNGWEAVRAEDFPDMAKVLGFSTGTIIRDGLILMERPEALTREARVEDNNAAHEAIRAKEEQLAGKPQGTIFERPSGSVQRHHGPVEVPND